MSTREPGAEHVPEVTPRGAIGLTPTNRALAVALGRAPAVESPHEPLPVPLGDVTAFEEARRR